MSKPSENGQDPRIRSTGDLQPRFAESKFEIAPRWVRRLFEAGEITGAERSILDGVADETYSWNRPCVLLSARDLAEIAGVSRRHAVRLRDELVERGMLIQTPCKTQYGQGYVYSVPMHLSAEDAHVVRKKAENRLRRLSRSTDVDE
jgi:CRP-like cAMP-binding protein